MTDKHCYKHAKSNYERLIALNNSSDLKKALVKVPFNDLAAITSFDRRILHLAVEDYNSHDSQVA